MPAFFFKNIFAPFVAITGASTGKWHRVQNPKNDTHVPVNIDLVSGTGTIVIEGSSIDPLTNTVTTAVQILSVTVTGGQIVGWYPFMRVKVTGGTALNATVSIGVPIKQIEA